MERMLREWEQALARYRERRGRRIPWDEVERVVQAILARLQDVSSAEELRRRYLRGSFWALKIAREMYPEHPAVWDLRLTADVAYGLRFLELMSAPAPDEGRRTNDEGRTTDDE